MRRRLSSRCAGFALMLAVFMIVTLATVGLYLVTVSGSQVLAVTQDEQGVRAYQAARAGLDWGAFQLLRNGSCTASTVLTLTQGLAGYFARVDCATVGTETEGSVSVNVHRLTVTACNTNPCTPAAAALTQIYVERQLQLTITR